MKLFEQKADLFDIGAEYKLAHCVASDIRMGAGIAVAMQRGFDLRDRIRSSGESLESPTCVFTTPVFNLITKSRSNGKPTYASLKAALEKMREIALAMNIVKIAMPRIGCGLDRLDWDFVRKIIDDVFGDTIIEILVCVKP